MSPVYRQLLLGPAGVEFDVLLEGKCSWFDLVVRVKVKNTSTSATIDEQAFLKWSAVYLDVLWATSWQS